VQTAFHELLSLFGARAILLVAHDRVGGRVHSWQARSDMLAAQHEELPVGQAPTYLFPAPTDAWYAERPAHAGARRPSTKVLWPEQLRARHAAIEVPEAFLAAHPFASVLVVTTSFGGQWEDRLFVIDGKRARGAAAAPRDRARIGPAIHMLDLVGQLGSRVGAAARARVARELHDGVIQSLIGLEMQVEVWRRSAASDDDPSAGERLTRIQQVLRGEILDLRDLMQQLKPQAIESAQIPEYWRIWSGASSSRPASWRISPPRSRTWICRRVCGEIARIVRGARQRPQTQRREDGAGARQRPGRLLEVRDRRRRTGFGFAGGIRMQI
jgi:hypothetical protein